jgi:hypothetical protein
LGRDPVRLLFIDDLCIVARIATLVDEQDHNQVWYQVDRVVKLGTAVRPKIQAGHGYASDLMEIVSATREETGT